MFKAADTKYNGKKFDFFYRGTTYKYKNNQKKLNRNKPLTTEIACDPNHPITRACLFYYTSETFLYKVLNESSRNGDKTRISTLGPYAQILNEIVNFAG